MCSLYLFSFIFNNNFVENSKKINLDEFNKNLYKNVKNRMVFWDIYLDDNKLYILNKDLNSLLIYDIDKKQKLKLYKNIFKILYNKPFLKKFDDYVLLKVINNKIYIANNLKGCLDIFDEKLNYLKSIGINKFKFLSNKKLDSNYFISDFVIDDEKNYHIAHMYANKVLKFDKNGIFLKKYGELYYKNFKYFMQMQQLNFKNGNIYLIKWDIDKNYVFKVNEYNKNGKFIKNKINLIFKVNNIAKDESYYDRIQFFLNHQKLINKNIFITDSFGGNIYYFNNIHQNKLYLLFNNYIFKFDFKRNKFENFFKVIFYSKLKEYKKLLNFCYKNLENKYLLFSEKTRINFKQIYFRKNEYIIFAKIEYLFKNYPTSIIGYRFNLDGSFKDVINLSTKKNGDFE